MTKKEKLHALIEELPNRELLVAERFLVYLRLLSAEPALRAALSAPSDDEPLTDEDRAELEAAWDELAAGRVVPHEEVRQHFPGGS